MYVKQESCTYKCFSYVFTKGCRDLQHQFQIHQEKNSLIRRVLLENFHYHNNPLFFIPNFEKYDTFLCNTSMKSKKCFFKGW